MKAPIFSAYAKTPAAMTRMLHDLKPKCQECRGDGQVVVYWEADDDLPHPASGWLTCPRCSGTKKETN